jgi:hypothetical protein
VEKNNKITQKYFAFSVGKSDLAPRNKAAEITKNKPILRMTLF